MDRQYSRNPLRCQQPTVSGWTMTRISFHPDQTCDRNTQKPRSAGVIRGRRPFLRERGELLTKGEFDDHLLVPASKEGGNTAKGDRREFEQVSRRRRILHGVTAQYETDSSSGFGLSSVVDLSSTERKSSINPRRTEFENTQHRGMVARLEIKRHM
jgi:hypothetical protein